MKPDPVPESLNRRDFLSRSAGSALVGLTAPFLAAVPTRGADSYGYGHYAYAAVAPVAAS